MTNEIITDSERPYLIQAIRLIHSNPGRRSLMGRGNVIVSRQAPRLRSLGLIVEDP
jgi:hypothetical protein